jgi:formylmethanofuran:tetrahydromethanopterin formyltransferase
MKRILFFVFAIAFSTAIFAQQTGPAISWEETVFDFGTFKEEAGQQVHKFVFVNTGNEPLFLTNVKASCGCTATEYSKEPIQPGAKGYVTATYNPKGRPGKFNKSITVTSNEFQPTSVIRITGEVIPAPVAPATTN